MWGKFYKQKDRDKCQTCGKDISNMEEPVKLTIFFKQPVKVRSPSAIKYCSWTCCKNDFKNVIRDLTDVSFFDLPFVGVNDLEEFKRLTFFGMD